MDPTPYPVRFRLQSGPQHLELNHNCPETCHHPSRVNAYSKHRFGTWVRYSKFLLRSDPKYSGNYEGSMTCSSKCTTSTAKLCTGDVNALHDP